MEKLELITEEEGRADKLLLSLLPDKSRSELQKLIESGNALCEGKLLSKNTKLKKGVKIELTLPDPVMSSVEPEDIALDIVYEDDDLLIVNKPKDMVVHPAPGNYTGTLVNALMHHCGASLSGINGVIRPGIVHRIDKDTSGLLIVAKNDFTHRGLAEQIKVHSFTRGYKSIVYGNIKDESGTVNAPIGRNPKDRKQMAVIYGASSREAVTHYRVIERLNGFTEIELRLETGRTHQIRVHMAYIGHPVAGDPVYGPKKLITELHGQCLHAYLLGFIHPRTGLYMEFESELPEYFTEFYNKHRYNI